MAKSLIRHPGKSSRTGPAPADLLDLFPTLVELAGLPSPAGLEGKSLAATWREGTRAPEAAYSLVYHYDQAADRDVQARTVVMTDWRYTEWDRGSAGREVYLHAEDPGEYRNRAAEPSTQAQIAEGRALLERIPLPKPGPANRPRALDGGRAM